MGEWQVMPATARDPGFGVRPWQGGADDLARVGQDYRQAMEKRYDRNLPKMWGAYNAGPGRVDNLVARHGDNWLGYAPRETRDYIAGNMARVRGR